jgi:hypothetical protein
MAIRVKKKRVFSQNMVTPTSNRLKRLYTKGLKAGRCCSNTYLTPTPTPDEVGVGLGVGLGV